MTRILSLFTLFWIGAGSASGQSVAESSRMIPAGVFGEVQYGFWVDLEGDTAAVGAPEDDRGSIFTYDAATGELFLKIVLGPPEFDFGRDFTFENGQILAGTYTWMTGSAYLADPTTGTITLPVTPGQSLTHGDAYGFSCDMDASVAIVGAIGDDELGTAAGAAYLMDHATGALLHKLVAEDGSPLSYLGWSVAVEGELAVVGAPEVFDGQGVKTGAVYVFDVATGQQLHKLTPQGGGFNDRFGVQVELSGHDLIVGMHSSSSAQIGRAYLFDAFTGVQRHVLEPEQGGPGDRFGSAVTIDGPQALVGSPYADDHGLDRGAAYLYDVATGDLLAELWPSQAREGSLFGTAVALDGDRALVGAPFDEGRGLPPHLTPGAAYLFELSQLGAPGLEYCPGNGCPCGNDTPTAGCTNSTGMGAVLTSSGTPSVEQDDLELHLQGATANQSALVYMGGSATALPFGDGLRCVSAGNAQLCRFPIATTDASGVLTVMNLVGQTTGLGPGCSIEAGATWYFQGWYRDPAGTCGSGFNLSSARSILFAP